MFVLLEVGMVFHGLGVAVPPWADFASVDVDVFSFYRLQSLLESVLNAFLQSIIQSRLYIEGNNPSGIHVYIDTTLFLFSVMGSFASMLKSFAVAMIEPYHNSCSFSTYCARLVKFQHVKEYDMFGNALVQAAGQP